MGSFFRASALLHFNPSLQTLSKNHSKYSMNILGISAFYHDSAACLVQDGEITAAAQEERFTRLKHDARFPHSAIEYCLSEGGISGQDLDQVFQEFLSGDLPPGPGNRNA